MLGQNVEFAIQLSASCMEGMTWQWSMNGVMLLAEREHDLEHELGVDVDAVSKENQLVHLGHGAGDCLQADRLGDLELLQRRDLAQHVIGIRPPLVGPLARERCCR